MPRLIVSVVLAVLGVALPALAHEGHTHKLMGTVTAVHADQGHVEMKDMKGATQFFYVDKSTKILKGRVAVALADLKPGTRVVVAATTTGGRMVASEVKVGAAHAAHAEGAYKH